MLQACETSLHVTQDTLIIKARDKFIHIYVKKARYLDNYRQIFV